MKQKKSAQFNIIAFTGSIIILLVPFIGISFGKDLPEIKQSGVLRHLGIPYAKFVTGSGDGLDAEMVKLFARQLGVEYKYVMTSWKNVIGDLTGKKIKLKGDDIEILDKVPVRGDIIANGLTVLPWREKVLDYSIPTFPSGVWLIARADSPLKPIKPSGNIHTDIKLVKTMLEKRSVLAKQGTCLDPSLYNLYETGAKIRLFSGLLNELAPAILNNDAETSLLDVPDALVALEKWPGKIKVIGPISPMQQMGCGFEKNSPKLRLAYNHFFNQCKRDGTYLRLTQKYYPLVFSYFPDFFKDNRIQ